MVNIRKHKKSYSAVPANERQLEEFSRGKDKATALTVEVVFLPKDSAETIPNDAIILATVPMPLLNMIL